MRTKRKYDRYKFYLNLYDTSYLMLSKKICSWTGILEQVKLWIYLLCYIKSDTFFLFIPIQLKVMLAFVVRATYEYVNSIWIRDNIPYYSFSLTECEYQYILLWWGSCYFANKNVFDPEMCLLNYTKYLQHIRYYK